MRGVLENIATWLGIAMAIALCPARGWSADYHAARVEIHSAADCLTRILGPERAGAWRIPEDRKLFDSIPSTRQLEAGGLKVENEVNVFNEGTSEHQIHFETDLTYAPSSRAGTPKIRSRGFTHTYYLKGPKRFGIRQLYFSMMKYGEDAFASWGGRKSSRSMTSRT